VVGFLAVRALRHFYSVLDVQVSEFAVAIALGHSLSLQDLNVSGLNRYGYCVGKSVTLVVCIVPFVRRVVVFGLFRFRFLVASPAVVRGSGFDPELTPIQVSDGSSQPTQRLFQTDCQFHGQIVTLSRKGCVGSLRQDKDQIAGWTVVVVEIDLSGHDDRLTRYHSFLDVNLDLLPSLSLLVRTLIPAVRRCYHDTLGSSKEQIFEGDFQLIPECLIAPLLLLPLLLSLLEHVSEHFSRCPTSKSSGTAGRTRRIQTFLPVPIVELSFRGFR